MKLSYSCYVSKYLVFILLTCTLLLTSCDSSKSSSSNRSSPSNNIDFKTKVGAVNLSQVKIYEGHVKEAASNPKIVDIGNLNSGDLITIDIAFEVNDSLKDYALFAYLFPLEVYKKLEFGKTLGSAKTEKISDAESDTVVGLGVAYIDKISTKQLHGVIHTKLPVLESDMQFKLVVLPSLDYLAANKPNDDISEEKLDLVPVLFNEGTLHISKLSTVKIQAVQTPNLKNDTAFTQLEIKGRFDANGYTQTPILQTSMSVDLTSFKFSEEVEVSIKWESPSGLEYPLGLLTPDDTTGKPLVKEKARYSIKQKGYPSMVIPVVAYASKATHKALVEKSTFIKNVKAGGLKSGKFKVTLKIPNSTDLGVTYPLNTPLVSYDPSPKSLSQEEAAGFTVLRAGESNSHCLTISLSAFDIDTGKLSEEGVGELTTTDCATATSQDISKWRYDELTRQIISKEVDSSGNNHCLSAQDVGIVNQQQSVSIQSIGIPSGNFKDVKLEKCEFQVSTVRNRVPPGTALHIQRFDFTANKIKLIMNNNFLTVSAIGTSSEDIQLIFDETLATTFINNIDGINIDNDGRLFYVGVDENYGIGDVGLARVNIAISGESFLDYMPIIGLSAVGNAVFSASLLGHTVDVIDAKYLHKRYLPHKLSIHRGSQAAIETDNGASYKINLFGKKLVDEGEIVTTIVTDSLEPSIPNMAAYLSSQAQVDVTSIANFHPIDFKIDNEFLSVTYIVGVIPITLGGGFKADIDVNADLLSNGVGLETTLTQGVGVSGYFKAELDLFLISAGVEGGIEVIKQSIGFSGNAGLSSENGSSILSADIQAKLDSGIKLLKGEVSAFYTYRNWRGKKKRKSSSLYNSPYLMNGDTELLKANIPFGSIKY